MGSFAAAPQVARSRGSCKGYASPGTEGCRAVQRNAWFGRNGINRYHCSRRQGRSTSVLYGTHAVATRRGCYNALGRFAGAPQVGKANGSGQRYVASGAEGNRSAGGNAWGYRGCINGYCGGCRGCRRTGTRNGLYRVAARCVYVYGLRGRPVAP